MGTRIFATDIADSFHILKFNEGEQESTFFEICDDVLPRWITTATPLDYHTIAGADKFENIFICKLPECYII